MPRCIDWLLICPCCGFEFCVSFVETTSEEDKIDIRTCPCGSLMEIVGERSFDNG